MTVSRSSKVRVKRKGQVTIPSELSTRLGIEEGALLEIEEQKGLIVLKLAHPLRGGEGVGGKKHQEVLRGLDQVRSDWGDGRGWHTPIAQLGGSALRRGE